VRKKKRIVKVEVNPYQEELIAKTAEVYGVGMGEALMILAKPKLKDVHYGRVADAIESGHFQIANDLELRWGEEV